MPERAIFLDRDNTIIDNDGYLGDPSKVKLLPGAGAALAAIRALGYRLIVVSNQSGVARGLFDENAVEAVNDEMSRQLKESASAFIDASYYCPYHPEAPLPDYRVDHDWRKPKPGMLKQAAIDFSLDLHQCWMIGDAPRDVAAGAAVGCRTILLRDSDRQPGPPAEGETGSLPVSPNFVVRTLADAARILAREGRHVPAQPVQAPAPAAQSVAAPPAPAAAPATASPTATEYAKPVKESSAPPRATSKKSVSNLPAAEAPVASAPSASASAPAPAPDAKTSEPATPLQAQAELLADRLAHQTAAQALALALGPGAPTAARLEKQLEELVSQLRQQNRNAELQPDFSYSDIAALILQIIAAAAFVLGLYKYFTIKPSFATYADIAFAELATQSALLWLLAAATLQGAVITLLLRKRRQ